MKVKVDDIKYLKIDVGPRYWEDSSIKFTEDFEDDISWNEQKDGAKPKIPFAVYNDEAAKNRKSDSYRWFLTIDLDNMKILDWPEGVSARVFYKVCDDGTYYLLDCDKNIVAERNCYVPEILSYIENGYGDYIDMFIETDGSLYMFPMESKNRLIQKLIDTESF